ncbi:UvrD-helicase domain-containing protein [Streptomyces sp. 7G]|uniref:UvrD-helicase domain-containing protein n=1 Tax=Streptomyces sp. 7G TaxID=2877241 RepID=UPI001CD5FB33|nr:UvrD-helicase domain-containing protein [Streptomyces sp. 7G]MCA1271050.1 UvrD-helicase domain-containing protein [Streptomyces sp. 7G]
MNRAYHSDAFATHKVEAMVKLLGLDPLDTDQWDFLRSETAQDLQAAPGSGKTTLIGLKLALMADAWTATTRGVCVLSHTNTAKNEITERVASVPAGQSLLRYPHFVGTIQSFVHTFLALPALRAKGVEIRSVDDDAFAIAAVQLLRHPRYGTLRGYLDHQYDGNDIVSRATFEFRDGQLTVTSGNTKLPQAEAPSMQQLSHLKRTLALRGIFRYQDMYAVAQRYLAEHPNIIKAVTTRFPFILLDEMQDTNAPQHELLDSIFTTSYTVVQRVGDINQGIFSDAGAASTAISAFPLAGAAELPVSRRFGPRIAAVASALAVRRPQQVRGAGPDGQVAVLLYDEATVTDVVPTFERMAAVTVPRESLASRPPRVLGARHEPGTNKVRPQSIACYLPGLTRPRHPAAHRTLIDAARAAGAQWRSGADNHQTTNELWNALRTFFIPLTADGLPALSRLERSTATPGGQVRALLRELLVNGATFDEPTWAMLTEQLTAQIELLADSALKTTGLEFTLATEAATPASAATSTPVPATVVRAIPGSIASAKGETHTATLVLECLEKGGKKFDVTEALRVLAEARNPQRELKTVQAALQLIFVAATRPTHLLVLAAHRDRSKQYAQAMIRQGWNIRDLTEH